MRRVILKNISLKGEIKVRIMSQNLEEIIKSENNSLEDEPKKVKEYKEKAMKAMSKKHYRKAYRFLHKAKKYKESKIVLIDEFWMLFNEDKYGMPRSGKSFNMVCDICKEIVHPLDAHMGEIEGQLITAHIDCWNKKTNMSIS